MHNLTEGVIEARFIPGIELLLERCLTEGPAGMITHSND